MTTAAESIPNEPFDTRSSHAGRGWDILALGLFGMALIVYFSPLVLARGALFYFDVTELNYAYRHYFAENLKAGRLPFWCHQLYDGLPLYAESQVGYWHPLKYLFYPWMSTWAALGYDMVASLAVTGLGTYVWLRRHSHPAGALAGALIATFGGFTWAHFVHTSMINALAAVPWIIWGIERSWRTGRFFGAAVAAVGLASQVFAGHLQDALFSVQLIALMTFYGLVTNRSAESRRRVLATGLVGVVFGVGIAAVQWLPSYDLLKRTPRTEGLSWLDQTFGSWHPQLLPTLFVREAYGSRARDTDWMDGFYPYHEMNAYLGATAMMLALVGMRRWRDPWVGLWLFVGFVAAVFMLGRFTLAMDFWHRAPVLGSSRIPVRYHLWAMFATAALASQGIDRLVNDRVRVRLRSELAVLGVFAVAAIGVFAWGMIPWWTEAGRWTAAYHQERNQWLSHDLAVGTLRSAGLFAVGVVLAASAGAIASKGAKTAIAFGLSGLIGVDLISAHWHEMPTVDPSFWTNPPAAVGIVNADPKASRVMGIARYSAGEPGYASKAIDFFAPRDALGWSLPLAYGLESNVGETPFRPARLIRLTDLAGGEPWRFSIEGVTHLITGQPLRSPSQSTPADSAFVYRLAEPEPRFHWARTVRIVANEIEAESAMKELGAKNVDETLVVESQSSAEPVPARTSEDWTAGIEVTSYGGDTMAFSLSTPSDAWLRLGVSYDPGWRAWIDGVETPIQPAQLAFMAVLAPAGTHVLQMRYVPVHFRLGAILTGASMLVLVGLSMRRRPLGSESGSETFERGAMTRRAFSPRVLAVSAIALVVASSIGWSAQGGFGVSSRWNDSWHRFTWGAGIEAMVRK